MSGVFLQRHVAVFLSTILPFATVCVLHERILFVGFFGRRLLVGSCSIYWSNAGRRINCFFDKRNEISMWPVRKMRLLPFTMTFNTGWQSLVTKKPWFGYRGSDYSVRNGVIIAPWYEWCVSTTTCRRLSIDNITICNCMCFARENSVRGFFREKIVNLQLFNGNFLSEGKRKRWPTRAIFHHP